ncbi:MAG TPA: hypothetical protein VGG75_38515 [Trebonia sp.]|jgi:hypothetical protein
MQDLSEHARGSLAMSSSMAGGNVLSEIPKFGSPGSPSEQTSDIPWGPSHNDPEPQIGAPSGAHTDTKTGGSGEYPLSPRAWKKVP